MTNETKVTACCGRAALSISSDLKCICPSCGKTVYAGADRDLVEVDLVSLGEYRNLEKAR